ncbi:MAG: tRNA-dihydrouridine synthase [bacterium]|nr:tRNA-dihydrouridine synthase [bacterium]
MQNGFWGKLQKPIMVLAPMANVTDVAFRRIIAKYSKPAGPDVMWTEFVSADGLMSAGQKKLLVDLQYSETERPIVAQLFSGNPEKMFEAGKLIKKLGFDGLDINMGCPDRSIEKSGAGAALMKNPALARAVLRSAKEGAYPLPVSVKTRLGYNKDELETWLPELLAEKPSAVTIHARTRKEMSKVPAHWERVKRAVEIRNQLKSETLILGNGDVLTIADANKRIAETGADGVMLGRAIFGNPFLFAEQKGDSRFTIHDLGIQKRLKVLVEHTKLFEELLGKVKNFAIMKKHFKAYVEGFEGAKELRVQLMETETAEEVERIVDEFIVRWNITQQEKPSVVDC